MNAAGIDYGLGQRNIDRATGMRYGVIATNSVNQDCTLDFDMNYGQPHCPKCGNEVTAAEETPERDEWDDYGRTHTCREYPCETCKHWLGAEYVFADEPLGFSYEGDGYQLADCLDSDIFVLASPFYTFTKFCSPCVPGAGSLDNPIADGVKTFCLGHEWFDSGKAPYPVYKVEDDSEVAPPKEES